MKKLLYGCILAIILVLPIHVNADDKYKTSEEWVECQYKHNIADWTFYYNRTTGVFEDTITRNIGNTPGGTVVVKHNIIKSNFVNSNNDLYCPNFYLFVNPLSRGAEYTLTSDETKNNSGSGAIQPSNHKVNKISSSNKDEIDYCVYSGIEFTLNVSQKKIIDVTRANGTVSNNAFEFNDLYDVSTGTCKCIKLNVNCYNNQCGIDKNGPEKCPDGEVENSNTTQNVTSSSVYTGNFKFCDEDGVLKTFQIVGYLITLIKVLVPLLLIIFGSIDFGKAIVASDDKAIQSAARMLVIRAVGGIIIFFIPTIINAVTGLISNWSSVESEFTNCSKCLLKTGECEGIRQNTCTHVKHGSTVSESETKITKLECTWDGDLGSCTCNEVTIDK